MIADLVCGSISGFAICFSGYIFDTLKVRIQLKEQRMGFLSLFSGIYYPMVTVPAINAVVFASYEFYKKVRAKTELGFWDGLQSGAFAGFINNFIVSPVQLVKCTMQKDRINQYSNSRDCFKKIIRTKGFKGIFKGSFSCLVREIPAYALQFAVYQMLKEKFVGNENRKLKFWQGCLAGGLSGIGCWIASYPQDLIKTQIQVQSGTYIVNRWIPDGGFISCASQIYQRKGIRGFIQGLSLQIALDFQYMNGVKILSNSNDFQIVLQVSKMNIYCIKEHNCALEEIGCSLQLAQRMKLQLGLLALTDVANSDQLLFWGKISTTGAPYYIAQGINFKGCYAFPHKKFYYSGQNFIFAELPNLDQFNQSKINDFNNLPFTGNPAHTLINVEVPEEQQKKQNPNQQAQSISDQDDQKVKIVPKNYTQLDRLSYTVQAIEIQCQISPVGAYTMTPTHQIRYNQVFKGLKFDNLSLSQFQHFRYPQNQQNRLQLESVNSILKSNIFDSIENISFWSIQSNTSNKMVTVRSLIWQGYLAYNFLNSNVFGGVYWGNGLKSVDLPFCL